MQDNSIIVAAVAPVLVARGLELYDIETTGAGRATVLRVLVTVAGPGGPDLAAIASATEAISPVLDEPAIANLLPASYALEVSSPGLERPLRRLEHYTGAVGEVVSVKVRDAERVRGTLIAADDAGFELQPDGGDPLSISYDDVVQARTVFEWGATAPSKASQPREAAPSREKARR
jgi:ribosome maturation factor RimP